MNRYIKSVSVFLVILFSISSVSAATLTQRLADGHKLRLGFGTAVPKPSLNLCPSASLWVNVAALTDEIPKSITRKTAMDFKYLFIISPLIKFNNRIKSKMIMFV